MNSGPVPAPVVDPPPPPDASDAVAPERRSRTTLATLATSQTAAITAVLIAMCIALSLLSPDFLDSNNLLNVARQVSLIVIVGCGMTFVITSAGLDISVGSMLALTGVVGAGLAASGWPLPIAVLAAILLGGLGGLIHAGLIVRGKITAFIATLGTMYALRGAAYLYTQNQSGGTSIVNGLPDEFRMLGQGYILGIPIPVVIAAVVAGGCWFLYNRTLLGRYTRAIGGNRETAYLSGVRVDRVLTTIYVLTGLLAGLSGFILASRLASGQPSAGQGFEFDVIIAVVIGGTSLFGGRGSIAGTVLGALIIGVLSNGLNLLDIGSFWQQVVKGVVLIAAVLVDTKWRGKATT
jgi:ribose/xylose/arabinose/galactoside ABC-type transport system permease subunit